MYMLPLNVLLEKLGLTPEQFRESKHVTIPTPLLKFLLQATLLQSDFDEKEYMDANPDVAEAVRRGRVKSAKLHFLSTGYLESRSGGYPAVDEGWYLSTYQDVAKAVRAKQIDSATVHFAQTGAREFRAPAAPYVRDVMNWASFFEKGDETPTAKGKSDTSPTVEGSRLPRLMLKPKYD